MISVIIPTHNYGHYISETLESLLEQTEQQWECIIIDDGSSDETREVVNSYVLQDSRFSYIYQDCQGVSAARNVGLAMAKGEYIQFLDADDVLLPRKLEMHKKYLEQHLDIDIVYSNTRYFANNDRTVLSYSFDMNDKEWMPMTNEVNTALCYLLQYNIMPIHAPLSRANLLQKVGYFTTATRYCEDWDYWLRCAIHSADIRYLDQPEAISLIRVHQASATNNSIAMATGARLVKERAYLFIESNPDKVSSLVLNTMRRALAIDLLKAGKKMKGLKIFAQTVGRKHGSNISITDMLYWIKK